MKDEWEIEMSRILDVFEHESELSFRMINRRFELLDRPFNDEFRQYFSKMTMLRFTQIDLFQSKSCDPKSIYHWNGIF